MVRKNTENTQDNVLLVSDDPKESQLSGLLTAPWTAGQWGIGESSRSYEKAAQLIFLGAREDVTREGLTRTLERFSKAMSHLLEGYQKSLEEVVGQGVFDAEGKGLVSVREVEFYSLCEHHMLPFWGKASVAYYPNKKILGLSKIPRIINLYSRRFQVQERLTEQVADAIQNLLQPKAVAVRIQASHLCMMMGGVEKQHSNTVTETSRQVDTLSSQDQTRLWSSL